MKNRFPKFALTLALLLSLSCTALAVEPSTDHFVRIKTYSNEFSDLTPASSHYKNVAALYEYGLSVGKADGRYGMNESMRVGEVLVFAARIRSLYATGDPEAGAAAFLTKVRSESVPERTYEPYLLYLQSEIKLDTGVCDALTESATRAQVAHVLARTLPEEALPPINAEAVAQGYAMRRYIRDVDEYTPYQQDILALYQLGLSQGCDAYGSFQPNTEITRAEAASMLTRMVDESLRLTLNWNKSVSLIDPSTTLGDLVPAGRQYTAPRTGEELESTIHAMLSENSHSLSFAYENLTSETANRLMHDSLTIMKGFCEQMYNSVSCSYNTASGFLFLDFAANGFSTPTLTLYREETMDAAIALRNRLWKEGLLHEGMTQRDIALFYYIWICENTVYDFHASETSRSHLAYSVFHDKKSVCDGYTGAYNLLLKLEGIECYALPSASHIWSVATLDGATVHIDTTWGDSEAGALVQYFAMTPEESYRVHPW